LSTTKKFVEKRKHKRFQVKSRAYAVIGADYNIMGLITDIGKGGLAFQYIANGNQLNGLLDMNIFVGGNGYHVNDLPFKAISDFTLEKKLPFSIISLRRCSGEFGNLTKNQTSQLNYFLKNYTSLDKRSDKNRRQFMDSDYDGPERRSGIDRRSQMSQ
jgi:hypothetical protein